MIQEDNPKFGKMGYDPLTGAYHTRHEEGSIEPLTFTITRTISALSGVGPDTGPPLSESVDTDALNSLFEFDRFEDHTVEHLTFTHQGCTVTIYRNGHVVVYPPHSDESVGNAQIFR